ncbi:hypothetical protein H2199_007087 [Coniosporium tulheliwenetii]|uniref:Uncharacterized protein n=1 Tax=Coniosporium tulheliwenetii TaxID=3383036 RepID=A0ACC2YSP2_9PEZI|nr:hypothetical protein H2199_007087 [Cladosporium sp. JES 115]
MEYAPMDTTDHCQASTASYSGSGFLTPLSTPYEGRRDSIISSQSVLSYAQSFSSVSDAYSPHQMPSTPQNGVDALSESFFYATSGLNFEDLSPRHGLARFPESCVKESLLPLRNVPSNTDNGLLDYRTHGWEMVQRPELEGSLSLTCPVYDCTMPASGHFSLALQSMLDPHTSGEPVRSALESFNSSTSWEGEPISSSTGSFIQVQYPTEDQSMLDGINASYSLTPAASHQWAMPILDSRIHNLTVVPSDTSVDLETDGFVHIPNDVADGGFCSLEQYPPSSPCPIDPHAGAERSCLDIKPMHDHVHSEDDSSTRAVWGGSKVARSVYTTRTGGKGLKKERRRAGVSRRKSKARPYCTRRLDGGEVYLEYDGDWVRRNGKDVPCEGPQKKHFCDERIGNQICRKAFNRPEHLKRHKDTHSDQRRFEFDNPRDLFDIIKAKKTPEEAEKLIDRLVNWMKGDEERKRDKGEAMIWEDYWEEHWYWVKTEKGKNELRRKGRF